MLFYRKKKRHHNIKHPPYCSQQSGLSLIELMITIPLGLLIMLAVLKIFTANIQGISIQNSFSRVQENGRITIELMTRDIRSADYWGCLRDSSKITNHLGNTFNFITIGAQGINGENNVESTTISGITVKDATDTLTLRGLDVFSDLKIIEAKANSTNIKINTGIDIDQGDVLLLSDCLSGDLFINTKADVKTKGLLHHNQGQSFFTKFSNTVKFSNLTKKLAEDYTINAQIFTPYVKTYFIGKNSTGNYSLYLNEGDNVSELVRGINELQVLYGEDTNGDKSINKYATAATAVMDNVIGIRLQFVSSQEDGSLTTPLKRTYVVTENIRNRSL